MSQNKREDKRSLFWLVWLGILIIFIFLWEERGLVYFLGLGILFTIGKKIWYYIREKDQRNSEMEDKSIFLSKSAIFVYVILYVLIMISLYLNFLISDILFASIFILVMAYWFFYNGLIVIKTKKGWLRGFQLNKKASIIYGVLMILVAMFFLLTPIILKMISYLK